MSDQITVGIADMKLSKAPKGLITYALGSCIGICFYDPVAKIGALLHIMLPNATARVDNVFKYADTGIVETIAKMEKMGASRAKITAKIAGGAQMFDILGDNQLGNIGKRNAEMVKMTLLKQRIPILKSDVGGSHARTMSMETTTGIAKIRAYGQPDKEL